MGVAFFSLIAVLLLEQLRPLPYEWAVRRPLTCCADFLEGVFNGGERRHGILAWCVAVGGLVLASGLLHVLLRASNPLLGWLWLVVVLYLTMGFRRFSHDYADIQLALRMDDLPHARALLAAWSGVRTDGMPASEIARLAIEQALLAAHRHVFGVLVCFVLLPGPCGAVLYRAAAFFAGTWGQRDDADGGAFGTFSRQAFAVIDWLPARVTAAAFAIAGNFEDAVYGWRVQAGRAGTETSDAGAAIVLASGAGALGVCLGTAAGGDERQPGCATANVDFMQSTVGLIWRALLVGLSLLLLLGFAGLLGA